MTDVAGFHNKAFVSLRSFGTATSAAASELRTTLTSWNHSGGGFDIEGIDTFGGKITKTGTDDDVEVSFDVIQAQALDFDAPRYGVTGNDVTSSEATRKKWRVTLLWVEDETGVTSGEQTYTLGAAYRRVYANSYITNFEPEFEAGDTLKGTMTMKLSPVDQDGSGNIWVKSLTSGTLSGLGNYSGSTRW